MFLLVQLSNQPESLTHGLTSTFNVLDPFDNKGGDELAFATAMDEAEIGGQLSQIKTHTIKSVAEEMVVPQSMISEPYFVVPIEKRDGTDHYFTKVTIGRARNNDIVLRHPSVSKFHAMFLLDQVGALGLKDADSKNKTWVNGEAIGARVNVDSGDSIRIGTVETVLCNALTLRNTLDLAITQTH